MLHPVVRIGALASSIIVLAGCGLDEQGLVVPGGPDASNDVVALDAPKDAPEADAAVACSDAGPASCTDAAAFRLPALYSPTGNAPCPAGYDTHDLALAVPSAPQCECQCTSNGTPACDTTNVSYHYGFVVNFCGAGSGTVALAGACTATTQTTYATEQLAIDPPGVVGGCGGGTSLPPTMSSTAVRLCTPQCDSDESVCSAHGPLEACVYVAGDVPSCPGDYPAGPFYVGEAPAATCDGCSCTATGDCTASTLHLYTSTNCGAGDQTFPMDGTCNGLTGGQTNTFQSAKVAPNLKGGSYQCMISPGAAHTSYGGDSFTVCCE